MQPNKYNFVPDNAFPSDRMTVHVGRTDHYPSGFKNCSGAGFVRLSIAINTHYPEIVGGYYENARVIRLIEESFDCNTIYIVNPEYVASNKMTPFESLSTIETDELCLLVGHDNSKLGWILKWKYNVGGGGEFFSDNLIVDLLISETEVAKMIDSLDATCRNARVGFYREK